MHIPTPEDFWDGWTGHTCVTVRQQQSRNARLKMQSLRGTHKQTWRGHGGAHPDENKQPVLIHDEKVKRLDFAATPVGARPALVSHDGGGLVEIGVCQNHAMAQGTANQDEAT